MRSGDGISLRILYGCLFAVLMLSITVFFAHLFSGNFSDIWLKYNLIYLLLLIINSWYVMALVVYDDLKKGKRKLHPISGELISVIIPSYNEKMDLFAKTLISVIRAKGNKEIIIIDDGSITESKWLVKLFEHSYRFGGPTIKIHIFPKNHGKREALHYAVTHLVNPSSMCVVTIDSDTILDRNALLQIAAPLRDSSIGATTGDVQLLNEKQNLLTRMVGTYYWMGLNIYKKAQSGLGIVVCCSGCLSAYRTSLVKEIIDEFNNQYFLGEKATHSEDRHLTNLILKRGYKVVYIPEAVSYTETPATIKSFCRQQLRWKRGFVRESLYTLSYAWRNQKRLFFQILFWDLTAPYLTLGLRLYLLVLLCINPIFVLTIIAPLWVMATFMRYLLVVFRAPQKTFGLFLYSVFFEAVLYWVNLYALFTVKNKRWVTRGI